MPGVAEPPVIVQVPGVAKKGRPSVGKQVNIRLSDEVLADLEYIAESLDADLSHVIRAILAEHVPEHLHRAKEIRAKRDAARKAIEED